MRFRIHIATALLCCSAVVAIGRSADAQSQSTSLMRNAPPMSPTTSNASALPMPPTAPMSSDGGSQGYYTPGMSMGDDMSGSACGCSEGYCDQPACGCDCSGGGCGSCCNLFGPNGGPVFFPPGYPHLWPRLRERNCPD